MQYALEQIILSNPFQKAISIQMKFFHETDNIYFLFQLVENGREFLRYNKEIKALILITY